MTPAFRAPIAPHVLDHVRGLVAQRTLTVQGVIAAVHRDTGVRVSPTSVQRVREALGLSHANRDPADSVERFEDLPVHPNDPDAAEVAERVAAVKAEKVARGEGAFESGRARERFLLGRLAAKQRGVSLAIPGVPSFRESWTSEMGRFHVDDN